MMINRPEVKLRVLKKGDCFMFNQEPYKISKTYWENLGLLKHKVYVCRMKFEDYDTHFLPDIDVYRISCDLFDLLVTAENKEQQLI